MAYAAVGAVIATGCAGEPERPSLLPPPSGSGLLGFITIAAEDIRFSHDEFTAPLGQRLEITLDNRDDGVLHNIRFDLDDGSVKVPLLAGPNEQHLTVVFTTPGTFDYLCEIHPLAMRGTVTVG